jgi:hypothetical protein
MNILIKPAFACAVICFIATVFGTTNANAAPKQGLQKSYIGAAVGSLKADVAFGISGRFSFGDVPFSIRGTSYFADGISIATGSVTYDLGIAKKTNIYGGVGGAAATNGTTTVYGGFLLQAGAETAISNNVVIFGDGSFGDGYSIYKVGAGYSF